MHLPSLRACFIFLKSTLNEIQIIRECEIKEVEQCIEIEEEKCKEVKLNPIIIIIIFIIIAITIIMINAIIVIQSYSGSKSSYRWKSWCLIASWLRRSSVGPLQRSSASRSNMMITNTNNIIITISPFSSILTNRSVISKLNDMP